MPGNTWNSYNAQLDAAKAKQQNNSSIWNGLGNIGSAAVSLWAMCDRVQKIRLGAPEGFLPRLAA